MKIFNFFLAAIAGFGLIKLFEYLREDELEELDIHDEEEYPLFV